MAEGRYIIRGGSEGRERLRLLSEVFASSTRALLSAVGIPRGARCFDVGCGAGDVTRELALMAGAEGHVLGVDFDGGEIAIARREAHELGLENVHFEVDDVIEWQSSERFDVIYARFLLTHLADPVDVLLRLKGCLRPNGALIVEDIDFRGHFSEPANSAFLQYVDWYTQCVKARGADPDIGPKLPALFRQAGFQDLNIGLFHPVALEGGIKQLSLVTLESISEAILTGGLASEGELRQTLEALATFCSDPSTLIGGPRVFQIWSRAGL